MSGPPESVGARLLRADLILGAAIAVICGLVIALMVLLSVGARLHTQIEALVAVARESRSEVIAFTEAHSDAELAQRTYLLSGQGEALTAFSQAKEESRRHLTELRRLTAHDDELARLTAEIGAAIEQNFAALDRGLEIRRTRPRFDDSTQDALRGPTVLLHSALNRRIDDARTQEEQARRRLDAIAGALAMLSIAASGLALLALRRERTQWRLAHEAADSARAKAAASDLAKTRFLATASHDMRQPLHALTLYITALQRRVTTDEARDILGKMDRAAQSMSGMFSTLLDLARIQANVIQPEITSFPLADLLKRLANEHPGAQIRLPEPPTALHLRTDPELLERLLRNLVANAVKHGDGDVRIETRALGGAAEIAVIDRGPGIAHEDQVRIYEEFVRLDPRAGGEGLGLGLAIVKRIAQLLKLELELRSAPGEGAAFIVRAPIDSAREGVSPASPGAIGNLASLRILAVDDDLMALDAISGVLTDLGADTRACASERAALAALREGFVPNLMLMDLRLDGALSGIDVAGRLRAELTPPPRVIMITGDTEPETLARLRASGFAWLIKPVNPQTLIDAVFAARAAAD